MTQTKEQIQTESKYLCPHILCKKSFTKPIKTTNLQVDSDAYSSCPYCLTEVTEEDLLTEVLEENNPENNLNETNKAVKNKDCNHHLGYLSERSRKDQIPDDCMTCKDIVQCMLKRTMT